MLTRERTHAERPGQQSPSKCEPLSALRTSRRFSLAAAYTAKSSWLGLGLGIGSGLGLGLGLLGLGLGVLG